MGWKTRRRYVAVYWQDITTWHSWRPVTEVAKDSPLECVAIGVLLEKNNDIVRVGHIECEGDTFAEVTTIPAGCVRRIEYLSSRSARRG